MNRRILILLIVTLHLSISCKQTNGSESADIAAWKLGWRMVASSMDDNYELASLQFDSLRNSGEEMDEKFLIKGLEVKYKVGQEEEVAEMINAQDSDLLEEICRKPIFSNLDQCALYPGEAVSNAELQMELIKMYVDDQASRGNIMQDIIAKYNIDTTEVARDIELGVDERNRNRLKEIFEEYGFPTRALVGESAMWGIFLMIQHSNGDKEWQKSQLVNIEKAVRKGDLDGQSYAYLYDRIKINGGEKQLYGSQLSNIDPVNNTVELADTEDPERLDRRRMEMGMMPIKMYKNLILNSPAD